MRLKELKALRAALAKLCAEYGLVELSVFGSTARDEATAASDVDLLYVRGPRAVRGFEFFTLQEDLEDLLGRSVDLVSKDGLHWAIRDEVLDDAEVLYAA